MLNYFKAFSVFLLWSAIALSFHFFISNKIFKICNISTNSPKTKSTLINTKENNLFWITNFNSDTIFQSSKGFIINKNTPLVTNITAFSQLTDSIKFVLNNDYTTKLLVIGKYKESEKKVNNKIGFERAELIKKELIKNGIDSSKIEISEKLHEYSYNQEGLYNNGIEMVFKEINPQKISTIEKEIIDTIFYPDFDKTTLLPDSNLYKYTLKLKQYLQKYPNKNITITGHTDNIGYYQNNLIIGLQKANEIKKYFIINGIDNAKITTLSMGESKPIADKTTEEGRARNKRIEIKIN